MNYLLVFVGGGLGSICRYFIGSTLSSNLFYWGTLVANVLACIVLGVLLAYDVNTGLKANHKILFATGFCGGFSTFSTFSAEVVSHIQKGQLELALGYVVVSLIAGVIGVYAGFRIVEFMV